MGLAQRLKTDSHQQLPLFDPPLMGDPRLDMKEDSRLWDVLLDMACREDKELAGTLHGFRCMGTRIKEVDDRYVLRPDIDPLGRRAWESKSEYKEARDKWLRPHAQKITVLLQELRKRA